MLKLMSRTGRVESDGVAAAGDRKRSAGRKRTGGKHGLSQIGLGALGQSPSSLQAGGLTPAPDDGG